MVDDLNFVLGAEAGESNYERPRVAVLDTGIRPDQADNFGISDSRYQDFTVPPGVARSMRDDDGHGTSIVDLIYSICDPADVFVARVWDKGKTVAAAKTIESIIKALKWAKEHNVDIICMAFGFDNANPGLREALKEALLSANVLLFAAASNDMNRSGVVYPARWDDLVFCMFSTNGGAKNSRGINPTGLGHDNFAILGEDVRVLSDGPDDTYEISSGTSYSTAIACGLAARLLDFSRQKHVDGTRYRGLSHDLKEKVNMERVLRSISEKDEEYHCIAPWKLLSERFRGQAGDLTDEDLEQARQDVFRRIAGCLGRF
ncbi:extracellular alkaline serine protease [Colletotrichum musicola]|uniref:Extracellular alkaline serine protease n=1 Tax=Colletotrichum musicola TaxID=2175873 RepID=A0A8H6N1H2_9PEZI|nr:extracellular alkaline serine protease [Colletotrichum musicola]